MTNYSFNSQIQGDEIRFDYRLTPGLCREFNASKLMELMGIARYIRSGAQDAPCNIASAARVRADRRIVVRDLRVESAAVYHAACAYRAGCRSACSALVSLGEKAPPPEVGSSRGQCTYLLAKSFVIAANDAKFHDSTSHGSLFVRFLR